MPPSSFVSKQFLNFLWFLVLSRKRLFHSISFLPLIILFTYPFHLPAFFPQAYLLVESTRPFGSTTIYLTALDFYPPWPFSQSLDPIQFPHLLWSLQNLALSADKCHSVPAFSPGPPCGARTSHSYPGSIATASPSQMLRCTSNGLSRRKDIHFHIYYYSYQILRKGVRYQGRNNNGDLPNQITQVT